RQMIVVYGVELVDFDQARQVWECDRDHTLWLEQQLQACDEAVEIRNLRQHIIAHQQVGLLSLGRKRLCRLAPEEQHRGWDTFLDSYIGDVRRRLDSQNRNMPGGKVLE